ncbi:peptidase family S41 [Clostridium tepidiprofundi DSM 19306]|uniref:Peptidase family S41 n=1 Tax=Clostridium tepidiprofundi DSM 19306 TaxID=1121338 RepID=A0A151B6D1_9CLOT|nr:peptidase family S41 [Clostridium tepidiprofundi DSM 19306]
MALIVLILSMFGGCKKDKNCSTTVTERKIYGSNDVFNEYKVQQDLKFVRDKLIEVHPYVYNTVNKEKFYSEWNKIIESCTNSMTYDEVYFKILEGMKLINDMNTTAFYDAKTEKIPLYFTWKENGAWITKNVNYLNVGDEIIKIGNKSMYEILNEIQEIYPSKDEVDAMYFATSQIRNRYLLKKLGLIDSKGRVSVDVISSNNDEKIVMLNFAKAIDSDVKSKYKNVSYVVNNNGVAILRLNRCVNDENYRNTLQKFFNECFKNNVKYIALDLRKNVGGDISVLNEFLKFTDIKQYRTFDVKYRTSKEAKAEGFKNKLFRSTKVKIKHKEGNLYSGKLMVLVSSETRNEGKQIAVIFKENNIGKVISDCTGLYIDDFGKNIKFITPNTGIRFVVSTAVLKKPYYNKRDSNILRPDEYVRYKQKDIMDVKDTIIEWINTHH